MKRVRPVTVREASDATGLSERRIRVLFSRPPLSLAASKGEGRTAKVTVERAAFDRWMESRRRVRPAVAARSA